MNCPLAEAFTKTPSVLNENFLREFWCTAISYDPTPPANDSEERPLKEYKIKFTVMNGKKPLTLDFKTFVLNENYSSTEQVNSIQQLIAYCLITGTKVDIWEIIYSDLITRLTNKSRQKYVSYPRFVSCALEVLLGTEYAQDEKFGSLPNVLSNSNFTKDPSKVTTIELTASMMAGSHSPPDEGTRISQPLLEDKTTYLKDPEGNKHPADKGLPFMVPNESIGTNAKYQVDQTQSTRSEVLVPDQHQSNTSSEVELDFEPLKLTTTADIQALLGASDDLKKDSEDDEKHEKVAASYADLKWNLEDFINTSFTNYENTNVALRNFQQILNFFKTDHNTDLRRILQNLKEVQDVVKEDHALNKKALKAIEAYTKNSTNLTELLTLVKNFDFSGLKSLAMLQNDISSLKKDISEIKNMMYEIFYAFKGQTPPSSSVPTCLGACVAWMGRNVDIKDWNSVKFCTFDKGNSKKTTIEKQPTKEPEVEKSMQEPARASRPIPITIVRPLMRPAPKIEMMSSSSTIQLNDTSLEVLIPQPAVTDDIESPKKLVKTSSKVRPDPDEPVRVPYEIHGKLYHLTNHKIQEHLDKEEKMKKAAEKAKLLVMSKPELIKVVHKEALKDGIDPKILKSAKGGQEFKKIQDVEYKVLNREHSQKIKKAMELRKKRLDQYMWTTTSRLNLEPTNDVKIHPNTKPAVITVYRGTDKGTLKFTTLLSLRYERLKKIPEEPGIQSALPAPAPEQASSQLLGRKRKIMELEPEICIPGLKCNRSLPENVPYVNNMVIKEPKYGMFFIDVFGDEAFQIMNDIHKVDIETLRRMFWTLDMYTSERSQLCEDTVRTTCISSDISLETPFSALLDEYIDLGEFEMGRGEGGEDWGIVIVSVRWECELLYEGCGFGVRCWCWRIEGRVLGFWGRVVVRGFGRCLGYEWEGDGCEGLRGFGVSGVFVFVEWEGLVGIVGCGMGGVGWVMGGDGFLVGFGGGREGWGCGVMLVEGGRGGGGEVGGLWGGSRFGVRGLGLGI
ncbi:hypothetical protein Tco_1547069 [Tanacetum coccineum]